MAPVRIRPVEEIGPAVAEAVRRHRATILASVPGAEVEHVGSTAVPGAWSKGDVDLVVRVSREAFAAATAALRRVYAVHQPHNWTPTLASLVDAEATEPPVGIQLVVRGSSDDHLFAPFRDALLGDPDLLARYNALKRGLDGEEYQRYTDEKARFIERVRREMAEAPR